MLLTAVILRPTEQQPRDWLKPTAEVSQERPQVRLRATALIGGTRAAQQNVSLSPLPTPVNGTTCQLGPSLEVSGKREKELVTA